MEEVLTIGQGTGIAGTGLIAWITRGLWMPSKREATTSNVDVLNNRVDNVEEDIKQILLNQEKHSQRILDVQAQQGASLARIEGYIQARKEL